MRKHLNLTHEKLLKITSSLLCFVLPFSVVILSWIVRDVAPFGDGTICSMDGFSQYFPMLENMSSAVKNGEMFYSFSGALGFNLWAQNAYYTNSPLWLLIYILPENLHIAGINLLVAFKVALCAVFFFIYLQKTDNRKRKSHYKFIYPAFSCAWALSAYVLAFINQFMWLDVIMLFPLVILGLEKLIKNEKPPLYIFMLFLSIWSCFYIGYMVCIFVCLYFLYVVFCEKYNVKQIIKKGLIFTFSSLLAAGMAAVVLIPVYKVLKLTAASELIFTSFEVKTTALDFLLQLLPFRDISLEYGAPNIYCTVLAFVLCIIFFFQKRIPKRIRMLSLVFVLFMMLSISINLGEYIWHGFHFPNQLPARQSFLFIFLVLLFAFKAISAGKFNVKSKQIISLIMIFGCCSNGFYTLINQTWISKLSSLQRFNGVMGEFCVLDDNEFMRMEFKDEKKNNGPQQYSFNGVSYYSSTMSEDAYNFFQNLGYERYAKNVSVYFSSNEILDNIFGVKYLIEKDRKTITENKNALPLAFISSTDILNYSPENYDDSGQAQRNFWRTLTGKDEIDLNNDSENLKQGGMSITHFDTDLIKGTVTSNNDGILFTTIPYDEGWQFFVDGKEVEVLKCADYLACCEITKGKHEITMKYTVPGIKAGAVISGVCFLLFLFIFIKAENIPFKTKKVKNENDCSH